MNYVAVIDDEHKRLLESKRQLLEIEGEFWNEEELKMQFLAFVFEVVQINEPNLIKLFYERPLVANLNGYSINLICDAMLATPKGIGTPKKPYFFLQEYKKAKNAPDAEGQVLAAMLVAQHENNNNQAVFGCYIQGKYWTFCSLYQQSYCISTSLDATQIEDLNKVVATLKNLKKTILKQILA
jgi:hypothetical protein